jgi:hypothetical protein
MIRVISIGLLCVLFAGCETLSHSGLKPVAKTAVVAGQPEGNEAKGWVEAKTKKVWVNQHVDENGDLIEGHYKYVVEVPGHWSDGVRHGE